MDVKQGGRSVHDYSKLFNHPTQYAPDQVDTDDKKKDRFVIGLSTKLQERMALNIGGSFPEFVNNVIIVDEVIHTHKEAKKRKAMVAPSGSAPPKYRVSSCSTSASSSSGFPTHLSTSISKRHLGLYLHHRPCHAFLCH
jgi:hypothetical protein